MGLLPNNTMRDRLNRHGRELAHLRVDKPDVIYINWQSSMGSSDSSFIPDAGAVFEGQYARLGDMVHFLGSVVSGPPTDAGTGAFTITLPTSGGPQLDTELIMGGWLCNQTVGDVFYAPIVVIAPFQVAMQARYIDAHPTGAIVPVGQGAPLDFSAGFTIQWNVLYRADAPN